MATKKLKGIQAQKALENLSAQRIEDLAEAYILKQVNAIGNTLRLDEFDVHYSLASEDFSFNAQIYVNVFTMAGNTTREQFCVDGTVVKGGGCIDIEVSEEAYVKFVFSRIEDVNSTEYNVIYVLEDKANKE